ncbi:Htur_1727 family rSAM-partnered candidate RiPP [Salinirubrum litoreum]|uniref:Htur_1727 family rSAM-partnered candidate RiPP n=1 Tax=Salinirubrum litoreum TaxID=1126234 RepID=A0ABD5RBE3_9EURY|nr:Htur_1727 family rSAM-partnered candidate RiPP [Salinirubrum litoreum]
MSSERPREAAAASERRRVAEPRADETREWEVFVRETPEEPLRHAGSVTAPNADVAHEAADTLFERTADTIWCAPTDAVARFTTRELDSEYAEESVGENRDADATPTHEASATERRDGADDAEGDEEGPA